MKKLLATILTFCMIITTFNCPVFAAETNEDDYIFILNISSLYDDDSYVHYYNGGKPVKPQVSLLYRIGNNSKNIELTKDVDYKVEYFNNCKETLDKYENYTFAAYVKVTLIGKFKGKSDPFIQHFNIVRKQKYMTPEQRKTYKFSALSLDNTLFDPNKIEGRNVTKNYKFEKIEMNSKYFKIYKNKLKAIQYGKSNVLFKYVTDTTRYRYLYILVITPKVKKVTANALGKGKIKLSVVKNNGKGVGGYKYVISTNKNFSSSKTYYVSGKSNNTKTISGLKKGKKYYIKAYAYTTINKKKTTGTAVSTIVTVK